MLTLTIFRFVIDNSDNVRTAMAHKENNNGAADEEMGYVDSADEITPDHVVLRDGKQI